MKEKLLLTPGPTKIHPDILEALGRPIIHHRTTQFQDILKEVNEGLQYVFQTKNDIYLLAASGTGGMEACVANLVSPGDKTITVEGGKFGERWTELCQAYGGDPKVINVEWGKSVQPEQIKEILDGDKDIKAVFITLCETSTAVTTNVKAIADVVKDTGAILVVDGISGVAVTDIQTDNWGVDMVVSASHKGFMLPPGLAFVSVSAKAHAVIEKATSPRYYFDLRKSKKAFAKTDTPFTPAIGIIVALNESLRLMREEGLGNLFARFARLAEATRTAARALGMTPFPDDACVSNALTAINVPEAVDGGKLVKVMRDEHGVSVAGGQAQLKGKIIRIAHMGCVNEEDLTRGFTTLEKVLTALGHNFTAGAGVNALQESFSQKV